MFGNPIQELGMTAAEVREYLATLEAERALALETGVAAVASYMADLDEEIRFCRELYVASAVTEIATLRAELAGAQQG
jgi:DNA-binding GntR family transcriptional regulator